MNKILLIDGSTSSPQANQLLLIDKPRGWTSFDVVAKVRKALRDKQKVISDKEANNKRQMTNDTPKRLRVGHAGTLDPFATGLLIVLVGDATKEQDKFTKLDKEYIASIRLGATSTTGDPEGKIEEIPNDKLQIPNKSQISTTLKKFKGKLQQTPPQYSAIKINGKRAYELARAGKHANLKPRTILLYSSEVLDYDYPSLKIKVRCSSGTYIRTLAEDIGKALGAGAYLTELRRTKIGNYKIENAQKIKVAIDSIARV